MLHFLQFFRNSYMLRSNNVPGSAVTYVSGTQRFNFHKRPLVASINDVPLHLEPPVVADLSSTAHKIHEEEIIQTRTKEISCQTDYRDSEAQTDPYSPQEIFREGERPEVLMLKNLTYGHGLPASIQQLDQIQLNREKQWFQNSLPPTSDEASIQLRGKLMQEQQLREWSKKQNQLKKQNAEQLQLVRKGLIERQKQVQQKNAQRIQQIRIRNTERKNREIAQIQRRRIKIFRKQLKAKKAAEVDSHRRQIIQEYANFESKVYASLTREGLSLDKLANKHQIQPASLNTYEGLNEIMVTDEIKPLRAQPDYTRLQITHKKALDIAQNQIQRRLRPQQTQDEVVSNDIQALRNVQARPSTPTWRYDQNFNLTSFVTDLNKGDILKGSNSQKAVIRRQIAILFLQRVLRGRAQQNFMYEGKEKRLALIEELLIVSTIPNLSQQQAQQKLMQQYDEKFKNALLEGLQGEVIAQTLDALSKELVKVKQQAKIAKLVKSAEEDRKQREIRQAGNRNAQQILREREQHLYNQMVRMNQGTVDTYLDWIINSTVDKASTRQATIMTNLRRSQMNVPLQGFERRFNNNQTLIRDLVQSFLLPNIQRSKLKRKVELEQRRFQEAAKKSLQTTLTKTSTRIMEERGV